MEAQSLAAPALPHNTPQTRETPRKFLSCGPKKENSQTSMDLSLFFFVYLLLHRHSLVIYSSLLNAGYV